MSPLEILGLWMLPPVLWILARSVPYRLRGGHPLREMRESLEKDPKVNPTPTWSQLAALLFLLWPLIIYLAETGARRWTPREDDDD